MKWLNDNNETFVFVATIVMGMMMFLPCILIGCRV